MRRLLVWSGYLLMVGVLETVGPVDVYAQTDLAGQIAAMAAEPAVARAHWGVMVTQFDGTPLYALNAGQLFQPASNAKLFTTAAAIHLLGANRQFTTTVEGPIASEKGTTLRGDLILRGGGDANLAGHDVPYVEPSDCVKSGGSPLNLPQDDLVQIDPLRDEAILADRVLAAGVTHVTGDVIGDDTFFPWEPYPPDWAADDLLWGYGAPISALTVMDNQLQVKVVPAPKAGGAATVTIDPANPFYTLIATVDTIAAKTPDGVQIDRALGSRVLRVSGTIAADSKVFVEEVAIDDPALDAATTFKTLLEARGIKVDGVARAEHRLPVEPTGFLKQTRAPIPNLPTQAVVPALYRGATGGCLDACPLKLEHSSPTLLEDVVATNKESQNLHAELLLRQLGKAYGNEGSIAQGARVVRQFLLNAGLDQDDFVFYDGSGLSGHDLVTPRAVAALLRFASTQPWFAGWKKSLPVGGVDGSLTNRFTRPPLKGHVFAKTGTLGEARALGGYLECASGRTVIFSIMVGNHAPGTNADRDVMDRMVAAIAAAN